MLRWCRSSVRTVGGGHDGYSRFSRCFDPRTGQLSSSWSGRLHVSTAVPVTGLVKEPVCLSLSAPSQSTGPKGESPLSTAFLEDRPSDRTYFWVSHHPIETLRRFLSSENVTSDQPLKCSPTTIRSLYYRAESKNQLGTLDSRMLSLLISLFGSLSVDSGISVAYGIPQASRLLWVSGHRTHWAFVMKVGKYKLERGMPLQDSDRFWLMCAELAMTQARHLGRDAYSAILRARTHYHIIRRHSRRPEMHVYYLEALLVTRDHRLLDFAACDISFLLRTHRVCHPHLQRLLYRLVIQHSGFLSTRSQEAILAALWSRTRQGAQGTSCSLPEHGLSDITLNDSISNVTAIARSVTITLFGFANNLPIDRSVNSLDHLASVFSPAYPLPLRWSSLVFFSIFHSCEMLHSKRTHCHDDHAMPQVTACWQVIFGLATVEKILQELSSALATQSVTVKGAMETTRCLHQLWSTVMKSCPVSRDLACTIAASFLRIANVLADPALFYDCQDLYRAENSMEGPQTLVQKLFAAQYVVAMVRAQGPLPGVVSTALEAVSSDLQQQQQVLAAAVEALAPIDPTLAHTLYTVVQGMGMGSDLRATHTLALSFAQRGELRQAILLNDSRFSLEKRGILLSAIARSLRENPLIHHPQNVFVTIADEVGALYHSHDPPEHFRGHLEQLFITLAHRGRGTQLYPVVLSILRRSPSFFQPRFFSRYCRMLLRHRQFATANKLLDAIRAAHPKIARSLCILTDRIAMQTKVFRTKRIKPLRGPASLRLSSRLRRCPYSGPSLERSLQELLKSGRLLAAKHIFARAAATAPSTRRTSLGNILLLGVSRQPTPRNGRCVRKVLALLESLVKDHGFRPDRVTANILINVMMRWRSAFDSSRLRELFDQLVRGGYPAADHSPLHPPFGTLQTQFSGSSGISTLSPTVSFEKHVRPMFKMFIKAFYLCNDVEAARKVVGMLRVEEHQNATAKEARWRARTRGRIKAAQRNVPPD